jgi:hypothetical protein
MKKNKEKKSTVTEVDRIGKILECLLFLNTTSEMGRKIANKSTRKVLWSARPLGGALDVARGRARLGQGPRAQSFNFQEILEGSLAIYALINTHVNSWF